MALHMFPVGGWVRDGILGVESKDLDVTVVHPDGLASLADALESEGFGVHHVAEETFTCRARLPENLREIFDTGDIDVVLARVDGPSSDGRHPDWVRPGTLMDDLARRDFTVNAIAMDHDGSLIDPFDGAADIAARRLRFVGDPMQRIREDALRVLRALRFEVSKGFEMDADTFDAVNSELAAEMLAALPIERVDTEVSRLLQADSLAGMALLLQVDNLHDAIFRDGFHVTGTLKRRKF